MAEIDELKAKLTNIRTKTQQIADNLDVPYTAGEMTLTEIGSLLEDIEEHGGGSGGLQMTVGYLDQFSTHTNISASVTVEEVKS